MIIDDKYPALYKHYKEIYDKFLAGFPAPDPPLELEDFLIEHHLAVRTRQYGDIIHIDFPKMPWVLRLRNWLRTSI